MPDDGAAGVGVQGNAGASTGGENVQVGGAAGSGAPVAGQGGEGPLGSAGSPAGGAGDALERIWTDESASLLVTSWGLGTIYWIYEATRQQLTQEQLTLLDRLTLTEPSEQQASCDMPHYSLRITDTDGESVSYSVTDPECTTDPHVSFADFNPFQQTFGCEPQPWQVFAPERENATTVGPSRCDYRFYPTRFTETPAWAQVQLPATACQITVTGIALEVTLYDSSVSQELATMTTPADAEASTMLEHTLTTAGDYWVRFQPVDPEATTSGYVMFTSE
jgi:hypothetical protein